MLLSSRTFPYYATSESNIVFIPHWNSLMTTNRLLIKHNKKNKCLLDRKALSSSAFQVIKETLSKSGDPSNRATEFCLLCLLQVEDNFIFALLLSLFLSDPLRCLLILEDVNQLTNDSLCRYRTICRGILELIMHFLFNWTLGLI